MPVKTARTVQRSVSAGAWSRWCRGAPIAGTVGAVRAWAEKIRRPTSRRLLETLSRSKDGRRYHRVCLRALHLRPGPLRLAGDDADAAHAAGGGCASHPLPLSATLRAVSVVLFAAFSSSKTTPEQSFEALPAVLLIAGTPMVPAMLDIPTPSPCWLVPVKLP